MKTIKDQIDEIASLRQAGDSVRDQRVRQLVNVAVDLAFAPSDYLRQRYDRLVELLGHDPLQ